MFAIKHDEMGHILKFKARYVARGFTQQEGINCHDTYAPTASLMTLWMLFSFALNNNLHMASFEVSLAYLYSLIDEEIYVKPPTELLPHLRGKVIHLQKALYGTKQVARCWWLHFKGILEKFGFEVVEIEASLYVYQKGVLFIVVWMHVDDGLVVSNDQAAL